jgi:hypothetical protein
MVKLALPARVEETAVLSFALELDARRPGELYSRTAADRCIVGKTFRKQTEVRTK